MSGKKVINIIGLVCICIGIALIIYGATSGTVTGYKGADGKYYSDPDSVGSNEYLCTPGLIVAIAGGIAYGVTKKE